jgi:3-isopropylmalate dehydratase small subunit
VNELNRASEFRDKVKGGQKAVVVGKAFDCGSLWEVAVSALKGNMLPKMLPLERRFLISLAGAGAQAVIAKSFAFICGRNQLSLVFSASPCLMMLSSRR